MSTHIALLSVLGIVCIILIANRQIIGAGLYSVFSPLVMAGLLYSGLLSGMSLIILILSAFLAQTRVERLIKKIYWSQILKYLLITRTTLLLFFAVHYFWYSVDPLLFPELGTHHADLLALFAYVILFVSVSSKLFAFGKWTITRARLSYVIWFFLLSYGIVKVISSVSLFWFLERNSRFIIIIALGLLASWTYNGLQLKEIIRFRKLLWKQRSRNKYSK